MLDKATAGLLGRRRGVSPTILAFMLVTGLKIRPLIRPSARKDMARFMATIESDEQAKEFLDWGLNVLNAYHKDAKSIRGDRARQLIAQTKLPIFRKPENAFRVRWIL